MQAGGDAHHDSPGGGTAKETWYVVATHRSYVGRPEEDDPRGYLTGYFYMMHHWRDDIENRDGSWWIPYDTEEKCRIGLSYVLADRGFKTSGFT
ncbi:hypothetical protein BHE90_017345, partial [Fusarium euwallaceae]